MKNCEVLVTLRSLARDFKKERSRKGAALTESALTWYKKLTAAMRSVESLSRKLEEHERKLNGVRDQIRLTDKADLKRIRRLARNLKKVEEVAWKDLDRLERATKMEGVALAKFKENILQVERLVKAAKKPQTKKSKAKTRICSGTLVGRFNVVVAIDGTIVVPKEWRPLWGKSRVVCLCRDSDEICLDVFPEHEEEQLVGRRFARFAVGPNWTVKIPAKYRKAVGINGAAVATSAIRYFRLWAPDMLVEYEKKVNEAVSPLAKRLGLEDTLTRS